MSTITDKANLFSGYISKVKSVALHDMMSLFDESIGKMNMKESWTIMILGKMKSIKMRDLADSVNMPLSSMTGTIDKLIRRGLAQRERTDEDRRIVLVSLTEKGQELADFIERESLKVHVAMLETLSENEQEILLALFKKIAENLESHEH